jgi:hypothetical protein
MKLWRNVICCGLFAGGCVAIGMTALGQPAPAQYATLDIALARVGPGMRVTGLEACTLTLPDGTVVQSDWAASSRKWTSSEIPDLLKLQVTEGGFGRCANALAKDGWRLVTAVNFEAETDSVRYIFVRGN